MINYITNAYESAINIYRLLWNLSPLLFVVYMGVCFYWSYNMLFTTKPALEIATFGLIKLLPSQKSGNQNGK